MMQQCAGSQAFSAEQWERLQSGEMSDAEIAKLANAAGGTTGSLRVRGSSSIEGKSDKVDKSLEIVSLAVGEGPLVNELSNTDGSTDEDADSKRSSLGFLPEGPEGSEEREKEVWRRMSHAAALEVSLQKLDD